MLSLTTLISIQSRKKQQGRSETYVIIVIIKFKNKQMASVSNKKISLKEEYRNKKKTK
jgi:hypothetical protein